MCNNKKIKRPYYKYWWIERKEMRFINNMTKGIDKALYILPIIFAIISITMMVSVSYDDGIVLSRSVIVQTAAYILGFIAVFIISKMNYTVFEEMIKPLYIFSIAFLLTPYIPGLGVEMYGARSWIDLGITTFQPSEIVKISFIFIMAEYFKQHRDELRYFKGFLKSVVYAAPIIVIVLKEDFGSAAVFAAIYLAMLLMAGIDLKLFTRLCIAAVIAVPFLFKFLDEYQKQRITAFLYPEDLTIQANYQVWQSKIAIGSGGLFGKGLFSGTQKDLDFLPVRESDFIFSVVCEELGFIGGTILILLFCMFLYTLYKLVISIKDTYGQLIVIGFFGMFASQVFENIAMTMGFMPVTGITLPFISYGGSSVLANMLAVGIIINIALSNRSVAFIR